MERNDDGWKVYTFGMNDSYGHLIEIKMPARSYNEAVGNVKRMLYNSLPGDHPNNQFWLNDVENYN